MKFSIETYKANVEAEKNEWELQGYRYTFTRPLKYYPKLKLLKSGGNFDGRPRLIYNPETGVGYSYSWWVIVCQVKGKVVVNSYKYSNTTCRHHGDILSMLKLGGVPESDIVQLEAPNGLPRSKHDLGYTSMVEYYHNLIISDENYLLRGRLRQTTKDRLKANIERNKGILKMIKRLYG